ncbi:MAG: DNA topoisomerase 3 [Muribaculaceae bacterium]|nr:DNA topoisomerase 3 [Muribaculaceae bacterium]
MRVCITEKPSVAADIARILGATVRRDGFYEGPEVCVTWTFGHLCTLKEPADYTPAWRHWHLSHLPMLPQRFGIKLIQQKSIERQFEVIKRLISTASEVVNCGDAGQEGELIQRWVMQLAGVKCPVFRLWISSLTDEAIREGFSHLEPQSMYDNLYHAGLSRAIGDWLLGLNATRLFSLRYGHPGSPLSVGRVQTPTLALIVNRQKEIENFVPENFWELKTVYRDVTFNATKGRYKTEQEVSEAMQSVAAEPFTVTEVTRKAGREGAPRLFDLTSLQVECNRRWGWSAEESLRLIQSLYEKKVTTYPRVDTTYLPDDLFPRVPEIMRMMTPYAAVTAPVLQSPIKKSKKIFDNARITDHHAIIPTGQSPTVLVGDERKLYHLIALRFIAVFYPDCRFDTTTVEGCAGKAAFRATGKVITDAGWRVLYGSEASQETAEGAETRQVLPEFTVGESGPHTPATVKKTTQPPKYYTEGTLLRAMETAGRTVESEELREALKENGIGRPSTRAAIIETLFRRHYLVRKRKNILATEAGIELIRLINNDLLKSAALTGIWENKLRRIERGSYRADEFITELKTMVTDIVTAVLSDPRSEKIKV